MRSVPRPEIKAKYEYQNEYHICHSSFLFSSFCSFPVALPSTKQHGCCRANHLFALGAAYRQSKNDRLILPRRRNFFSIILPCEKLPPEPIRIFFHSMASFRFICLQQSPSSKLCHNFSSFHFDFLIFNFLLSFRFFAFIFFS